jgi:hypothetical protein
VCKSKKKKTEKEQKETPPFHAGYVQKPPMLSQSISSGFADYEDRTRTLRLVWMEMVNLLL